MAFGIERELHARYEAAGRPDRALCPCPEVSAQSPGVEEAQGSDRARDGVAAIASTGAAAKSGRRHPVAVRAMTAWDVKPDSSGPIRLG